MNPASRPEARAALALSLTKRVPTHVVAQRVLALGLRIPIDVQRKLGQVGQARSWYMADDFDKVMPATRQVERFAILFPSLGVEADPASASSLRACVAAGMTSLGLAERAPGDVLAAHVRLSNLHEAINWLAKGCPVTSGVGQDA